MQFWIHLNQLQHQSGGEMIKEVRFEGTTYNDIPYKFEAGTPNIADVIALNHAIEFINGISKSKIRDYENSLLDYFLQLICETNDTIKLYGTSKKKVAIQSFVLKNMHHFDAGMMLDANGIAVRTGHHCTQPLMSRFGIEGTIRASFAVYNTKKEIDVLVESLIKISKK